MATIVADGHAPNETNRQTRERLFFWSMTVVMALIVFIGFAKTYYLAGFHVVAKPGAPPPGAIVHIHGAVFTSWMLLLVAQASLVASGRVDIHRWLGIAGMVIAPLMVVLGMLVADEMLHRLAHVPRFDSKVIFAVALSEIFGFAVPVSFAFRLRRRPDFHKRLILIGTTAMMTAGFGRWPVQALLHKPLPAMMATFCLLLVLIAYDLTSMGKVHRATAFGAAWVVGMELTAIAVGPTAAWHSFAAQVPLL